MCSLEEGDRYEMTLALIFIYSFKKHESYFILIFKATKTNKVTKKTKKCL